MDKATELLKALGVTKDVIGQLEDEDFDVKEAAKTIKKASQEELREALKNDTELNEYIAAKTTGQLYGTLRSELKRAGLSTEEVAEDKTIKDMVKALTSKLNEGKTEDLKELQSQLMEARGEIKRLQDEEIPSIQSESQKRADAIIAKMKLKEQFLAFPQEDLVSKKHNEGIFNALMTGLSAKYDIKVDESGNPILYQKGKDLRANIADGTKILEVSDAIRSQLDEYDFIIKSNGAATAAPAKPAGQEAEPTKTKAPASTARQRAIQMNDDLEKYSQK